MNLEISRNDSAVDVTLSFLFLFAFFNSILRLVGAKLHGLGQCNFQMRKEESSFEFGLVNIRQHLDAA